MEKLNIYRCGIWYSNVELDEESIETEPYEDFDATFSQQRYYLEQDYEIEDHCNDPFNKTEQFSYYFDNNREGSNRSLVYVRKDWKTNNHILIGIKFEVANLDTSDNVIFTLLKYKELKKKIVKLFREEYEIKKEN